MVCLSAFVHNKMVYGLQKQQLDLRYLMSMLSWVHVEHPWVSTSLMEKYLILSHVSIYLGIGFLKAVQEILVSNQTTFDDVNLF